MFKEFTLANANLIYQYICTKGQMISIGGTHMAELDLDMAMCVLLHGNRGESGNSKQWEWQLATARQDKRQSVQSVVGLSGGKGGLKVVHMFMYFGPGIAGKKDSAKLQSGTTSRPTITLCVLWFCCLADNQCF